MFLSLPVSKREKIIDFFKKEVVLVIATTLALISSLFSYPKIEYIDFKVLILLLNLMIVVAALKKLKVLDSIATYLLSKCKTTISLAFTLVFLTFFSSMLVTNDVALITFIPLSLILGKKANLNTLNLIVFQTLAANVGSALTPMGNPQNLFIYSYFNMSPMEFFKITLPLTILSAFFLIITIFILKRKKLNVELSKVKLENTSHIIIWSILFIIILLSVFQVINYKLAFICTVLITFIIDKNLFKKIDYSLLLTFIAFFIFIGNISNLDKVKTLMNTLLSDNSTTYFTSIIASQFISNVPATILLSPFTTFNNSLLLGVNIGGAGTLIASLASVISYKLFIKENPSLNFKYLKNFTIYNIIYLVIFIPLIFVLIV